MTKHYTTCYLISPTTILLSRDPSGCWGGLSSELGPDRYDDRFAVARQNIRERTSLIADGFMEHGAVSIYNGVPSPLRRISVLSSSRFSGTFASESDDKWFAVDEIPWDNIHEHERHSLRFVLSQERFDGKIHVGAQDEILKLHYRPRSLA